MVDKINALQDLPNDRMKEDLDRAVLAASGTAAANTHVLSGALKSSVRFSSEKQDEGGWTGEVSWNTHYAAWEMARDGHDPRAHLGPHEEDIHRIIERGPKYL